MRFARHVTFKLQNGKTDDFRQRMERDVLPMLNNENGFIEELALVKDRHGLAISLWEDRNSADAYEKNTYPKVLEKLEPVIEGKPNVEIYEVATTTLTTA